MASLRIIIAGGGTGGHVFPAIAIAHAVRELEPHAQILFVGAKGKLEMDRVPQEGFEILGLDIAGFNRSNVWKNFSLPFRIAASLFRAEQIMRAFKPTLVLGVGGYASYPVLRRAQYRRIPTVLQEQNSYPGKTNLLLGKNAVLVCVAYERMERFFAPEKIFLAGNPVRKLIAQSKASKDEGCRFFGLNITQKTILIVGGSLGALSINKTISASLSELVNADLQIIWQTGAPYFNTANEIARQFENQVKVFDFIKEMDMAYAAADVVISRAGALAIAELCIASKPIILVPYPHAAEDHQTSNAKALADVGAATLIPDTNVYHRLLPELSDLLNNEQRQAIMSERLHDLAIPDAAEKIAYKLLALNRKN